MEESSVTNPGKNVEEGSERFKNPMHVAAIKGDVEAIEALKKSRLKIYQEENGQTPLHLAVIKGKTLAVRKLISLGANLSKMNKDGYAPLHLAVLHDRVSLIEDLINIDTESDVDILDRNGNTALHIAVLMGNANAVRALLIEGANADLPNKEGSAPLHLAVIKGNAKVIDVLLKYVRKPNILDKNKFRPLHLAVLYNQIGAIRKIGKLKGAKISYLNRDGDGALHLATKLRNLEAIEALLDSKANVNVKNSKGFSPMHLAVIYRKLSATKIIARIDEANRFKNTPIHVSEAQKNIPALRLLCRSKANVNIKNVYGDSILHSVIMTDCEDEVKMLLDLGAKINVRNQSSGVTPLHVAVCYGNKDIIEMLLRYGADIHSLDGSGDMPIHSAAKFCSSVGIEAMIKHGEDLSLRDRSDLTPFDIVMVYVREDTFGTAVQTLTDLYKKRYLKRRSPLGSHEILKTAKLIFKFEIWKNFEHSKLNDHEYQSNIIPILRSYINDCFAEIRLMKSTLLHENFYLYEFVIKGWVNTMSLTHAYTSEVVLDHILDVSTTKGYPIYRDIIISKLERPSLLKKVLCLRIPAIHNGKTTFLDLDAVYKYLGNDDILNLLLAYSDPDPGFSESLNVKKRKLEES
ncbi:Serine/threonine-protein phosphatase 6 regulatory ankyrin repeat subunit B [Araneus ventricosus]|uniref:Serine/threonine-protein phosphatase 6 regulatory ankyrin repeat subunit B n=1 Tax=Araneus ventricosus TaxID=182803 RepID=A0A4Y2LJ13_ARAVE|nr:Serine/threonine-protein phosphatase 6 regulatory ankyrin repeat subunit B [Araneus ventricosus]